MRRDQYNLKELKHSLNNYINLRFKIDKIIINTDKKKIFYQFEFVVKRQYKTKGKK